MDELKTTKINKHILKKAQIYCVTHDIRLYEFVTDAVNEYIESLKREKNDKTN